jgi:hypothetical protein
MKEPSDIYAAGDGTPVTKKEERLIRSLERLARRWKQDGNDLMLFSHAGTLTVLKRSCIDDNDFQKGIVTIINGIVNDGGDP